MLLGVMLCWAGASHGATLIVTNAADQGSGTLREALTTANLIPGPDAILFNLPGEELHTITLLSALPAITDPLLLDGASQPGYDRHPRVELDGLQIQPPLAEGIELRTTNASIRGLTITGFSLSGILIEGGGGHVIVGNVIGADPTGQEPRPNGTGIRLVDSTDNTIGGVRPGEGNLVSGNGVGMSIWGVGGNLLQGNVVGLAADGVTPMPNGNGVWILTDANTVGGPGAGAGNVFAGSVEYGLRIDGSGNVVQGNFIGVDRLGMAAVGNGTAGLWIAGGTNNTIGGAEPGAGNVISGNAGTALDLSGHGHVAQGNVIGLNAAGTGTLPNGTHTAMAAVLVQGSGHTLGGAGPQGNVISGNAGDGLYLAGESTVSNVIQGNVIGLSAQGNRSLGNGRNGLVLEFNASQNTIGGLGDGDGNVISGNHGTGIVLGTAGNVIQANRIGLGSDGVTPMGNLRDGIQFFFGATNNLVGGVEEGAGNHMGWNRGHGISHCTGNYSRGNSLLGNRFHDNGGLGIRYLRCGANIGAGPIPNDPLDADMVFGGPQNHPVLTQVVALPGQALLSGVVESQPVHDYLIEVYLNDAPDPTGYGEGAELLERFFVTTDTNGMATFNRFLGGTIGPRFLTATATDAMMGDTSEFGPYLAMPGALRITRIERGESDVTVEFTSRAGESYRLMWVGRLGDPFEFVTDPIEGGGGIERLLHTGGAAGGAGFYQVWGE